MAEKTELQTTEQLVPKVEFKPAEFEIKNFDYLKAHVNEITSKYKDLIVTEDQLGDMDEKRKELDTIENGLKRARIDTEKKILENFLPEKEKLMALEKEIKGVSTNIKNQVTTFKEQEKKRVQDEKIAKITKIADEVAGEKSISRDRFEFQNDWLKSSTALKTIKSQLEEQAKKIIALDKQKEANKITIEHAAEYYGLEAIGYVKMLDQYSFEEIQSIMVKAAEEKKQREAIAQQAQEAKQVVEETPADDLVLDPQQMQREADEEASAVVDKPVEVVENVQPAGKDKYLKLNNIKKNEWKFVLTLLSENGISYTVVEPK